MTTDELIELVAKRDRLKAELNEVYSALERANRVKGGHYVGSDGRCLQVTEAREMYAAKYEIVPLNQALHWKA